MKGRILESVFICAAMASVAAAQLAEKEKQARLTPELALSLRSISDLQFSPDGARVAFSVFEPPKETMRARHIWVLDVGSREVRQYTFSAKSESSPRWSPDGRKLAFLSNREEFQQIYALSIEGGEATRLTEGRRSIEGFVWSPDGKQIAFLAPEPKTEAEEKKEKDKDDARVVDRDVKRTQLWLLEVDSGKVRPLIAGHWQVVEAQWLPSGDALIVSATDRPESDQETNRVYLVQLADGKMRELAAPKGPFDRMRVSPDGKMFSYLAARVDGPSPHDLCLQPIAGGANRNLTAASLDRPVGEYTWRPDGRLLAVVATGFKSQLVFIATDGRSTPVPKLQVNPTAFAIAGSGMIAFAGETAMQPQEVWLWDLKNPAQRVSRFNSSWAQIALSPPEFFPYKSFDGVEIEGALLKPLGYDGKSKLPLVVLVHGGPTGRWSDSVETWGQLLAARGYAVFYPNVRGSAGYGWRFLEMNRGDWGGSDFRDVMSGVDAVVARGIADPNRLGIGGWSYGGYMAEWAITQTPRFKAAVSGAGMANLISEFGTEQRPAYDEWFYGLPYEKPEGFLKSSPLMYLKNARTPTLILQGEADLTDPLGQSQELYRGLKRYGVESEFVVYPREGHGLREEKHLLDRLNRILVWFDKYLK